MLAQPPCASRQDHFSEHPGIRGFVVPPAGPERNAFYFVGFSLMPASRILLSHGRPVMIGSRAFDLLLVLAQAAGRIVSKNEIIDSVWPTTTVDESNLRFQVAALRRALGCDRDLIKTIPGRGYILTAAVTTARDDEVDALSRSASEARLRDAIAGEPSTEALTQFFQTAGRLVSTYGSIDAVLSALRRA